MSDYREYYKICLNCHHPNGCIYEDRSLTESQQGELCPLPNPHIQGEDGQRRNSHLSMTPWKKDILYAIKKIIDERGPVPLTEFQELDINRSTLHAWRSRYLKTKRVRMPYKRWKSKEILLVTGVIVE